jgi:hypothetical protein
MMTLKIVGKFQMYSTWGAGNHLLSTLYIIGIVQPCLKTIKTPKPNKKSKMKYLLPHFVT